MFTYSVFARAVFVCPKQHLHGASVSTLAQEIASPYRARNDIKCYIIVGSSYTPNTSFITWIISPSVA